MDGLEDETHHAAEPPLDSDGPNTGGRHNAELDRNHSLGTAGLVVGWHNRVVSVVEGSTEESQLLLKLGHDPSDTTLTQLFSRKSCVQVRKRGARTHREGPLEEQEGDTSRGFTSASPGSANDMFLSWYETMSIAACTDNGEGTRGGQVSVVHARQGVSR